MSRKPLLLILLVALIASGLALPGTVQAKPSGQPSTWSQYQGGSAHTGHIALPIPTGNTVARRTTEVDAVDGSQPVIDGSRIYIYAGIAGINGSLLCYDLESGERLWKSAVTPVSEYQSWSSPAVSDGVVYIGSGSKVHALDAQSGDELWATDLSNGDSPAMVVNSSPAINGNNLVIGDYNNGRYSCLDTGSGQVRWSFDLDEGCTALSTPCITGGKVFVGQSAAWGASINPNGKLWCLDEETGDVEVNWGDGGYFGTDDNLDLSGSAAALGEYIYFTDFTFGYTSSPSSNLYCLSLADGERKWSEKVYGSSGAPAVAEGIVITSGQQYGADYSVSNRTTAFRVDTVNGEYLDEAWQTDSGWYTSSPCLGDNGTVAIGDFDTQTWAANGTRVLNCDDGSTLWYSEEGGSPAALSDYGLHNIGGGRLVTFGTGSVPSGDFYFAEGTTRDGYQEWLCLENSGAAQVNARVEYMIDGETDTLEQPVPLPPESRTTIDVNLFIGEGKDVAVHVTGDGPFVAERSIYFNANGLDGGEQVLGATATSRNILFAEGTTRAGYQTWLALQNPHEVETSVIITYLYQDGTESTTESVHVPAMSRKTVDVNLGAGPEKDVSIMIAPSFGNPSLVAERVIYFTHSQEILGARPSGVHNSIGTYSPSTEWFFAEGTTRENFKQYLCLMNPASEGLTATVTYLYEDGSSTTSEKLLAAASRTTIDVAADAGMDRDLSVIINASGPVVAERPMYFQYRTAGGSLWKGGHNTTGATTNADRWEFAEGCTRDGFVTYICIANPHDRAIGVGMRLFITNTDGTREIDEVPLTVQASSRLTVDLGGYAQGADISIVLSSPDGEFVAERAMYFSFSRYTGGGVALGMPGASDR